MGLKYFWGGGWDIFRGVEKFSGRVEKFSGGLRIFFGMGLRNFGGKGVEKFSWG